ncbi:hypothetical protein L1987_21409 [Smallanthus sonchifolius]|uniref:Uncharacterized protein n=1 Tax=Smallanthus sonchifolius TaxID=185202 RepID=A0ACB9IW60_9ASTR|nr:hypothetical protein L1987_21409 [Smallanthus sonchifolius]
MSHDLVLLSSPAYPEGVFKCNACDSNGKGFSYHCPDCQLDLYVVCASMPLLIDQAAHGHKLGLCFRPPYENQGFSCDICKQHGSNQWLYRCDLCEFDAHMKCATTRTTTSKAILPQPMKRYYSAPVVSSQILTKSTSLPSYETRYFSPQPPPPPVQPYYSYVAPAVGVPRQDGFINNMVGHAVEGAAGAVVQEIMQSVFQGMIS